MTSIACLVTILLNLLVLIAVKMRWELKKNSNILLSSVTLVDFLACFYATDYHVRHLSSPESASCGSNLYDVFATFLCAVNFSRLVIF